MLALAKVRLRLLQIEGTPHSKGVCIHIYVCIIYIYIYTHKIYENFSVHLKYVHVSAHLPLSAYMIDFTQAPRYGIPGSSVASSFLGVMDGFSCLSCQLWVMEELCCYALVLLSFG